MADPDPIAYYRETIRRLTAIITQVAKEEGIELQEVQFLIGPTPAQDRIVLLIKLDGSVLRVPLEEWQALIADLERPQ